MSKLFKVKLGRGRSSRLVPKIKRSDLTGFKKGEFGLGYKRKRRPSWKKMIRDSMK